MHAFRPLAIVLLAVWISCCSCASFDDLKKWGETLSLGGGLVDEAEKEIESALSLAPPSSSRLFPTESRLSRASAKLTEGQPSFSGPRIDSLQEQFRAAESYAAYRFSREALLSGEALNRWKSARYKQERIFMFNPEEQAVLLDYIQKRMLAQMDTAKQHPNLVSEIRFTVHPSEAPEIFQKKVYYIDDKMARVSPAPKWNYLKAKEERIFNLGALRFRMFKTHERVYIHDLGEIASWTVIARPLEGTESKWRAYVGQLGIPTVLDSA